MARYSHCSIFYSTLFLFWYFSGTYRAEELEEPYNSYDLLRGNDSYNPIDEKFVSMLANKSAIEQLIEGSIKFNRSSPMIDSRGNDSSTRDNNRYWHQMDHTFDYWDNDTIINNRKNKTHLKKQSRLLSIFKKTPDLFDSSKNTSKIFNVSNAEISSNCTTNGKTIGGTDCRENVKIKRSTICEFIETACQAVNHSYVPPWMWALSDPELWAIFG